MGKKSEYCATRTTAQSAGDVAYTDCVSAEELDTPPNECHDKDIEQSDDEAPVMLEI